jgi:NAD(P)H-hydrate epimerase
MRILSAESMREVDRKAIDEFGIPSLVLMENAALGLADAIAETYPQARGVAIFCGPGNNGGDGLALARHLAVRGYHLELCLVAGGREVAGDAAVQLNICQNQGLSIRDVGPKDSLHNPVEAARELDLVVDALFGVGLSRPLDGQYAELVEALNRLTLPSLAVDLPSGLNGSRWDIPGPHIEADLTVTFGAPKVAHIFAPAADAVGRVAVADLGAPTELIATAEGNLHLMVGEELATHLMPRPVVSHKGDYGHVLVVAGALGKAGAAILAARSAVRSGAGLVTAAVPEDVVQTVDLGSIESMTFPLSQTRTGALQEENARTVRNLSIDKNVLAVGPGLGRDPSTEETIRSIVLDSNLPVILDADGVNAFAGNGRQLKKREAETILTPHPGELARLMATTSTEVQADRVGAVEKAARETGTCVVLKGHQSLVASPEGEVFVNPTGNPGMASGGTGDVLTGLIAGLAGQGYEALVAAQLGVYLHGSAGDLAAEKIGQSAVSASDLPEYLPAAYDLLARE